ncbi:MAG: YhcH/YjgK/YiaL family protein [Blautia sp.]|nr:YhcH/YjgK/YiaL family protein [Blautia sp.]
MIYGNINVKETGAAFSPTLQKALEIIRTTNTEGMAPGKYPLDGDKLILQINEMTTEPKEARRAEIHRKYIDVQYMIHGKELIGVYPDAGEDEISEDRLESGDIRFYTYRDVPGEVMLPMTDGCYAIFFPEDAHRPGCMMGEPCDVRKIVLKVRVDTL